MKDFFQFEYEADDNAREIATPLYVSKPNGDKEPVKCNAIWDTGATSSMISANTARKLMLAPVGLTQIAGVHGINNAKCYLVDVIFGNGFTLHEIKVSEASDFGGFDFLVGMDIISRGIMLLDGATDNKLKVRFQIETK